MALYRIARYEVRADARLDAERAMHELAAYVRRELPDSSWTMYRDRAMPTRFFAVTRADTPAADEQQRSAAGMQVFEAAIAPLLAAPIDISEYELVTSSDLAPRLRPERGGRPRPRHR